MNPPAIGNSTAAESSAAAAASAGGGIGNTIKKKMKKMPTPKELVSHYEAKGMSAEEASLKVIDDLQKAFFRMAVTSKDKGGAGAGTTSRKLDAIYSRVTSVDMKIDSKPGYPQTIAIGVASGAFVQLFPRLAGAAIDVWNSVRSATKSNP